MRKLISTKNKVFKVGEMLLMRVWRYTRSSKPVCTLLLVSLLAVLIISPTPASAFDPPPSDLNSGPYVDKVVYKVIANQDQRVLALQSGEIEMDNNFFDPVHLDTLAADPDIDIFSALRNGYGHITINCRDYPLNISGLRRAFAFAFDKERATVEIMDGFSQEHDSLVPYSNGWCAEDEFDWNYYADQSDLGNQILDDLGFDINISTGFRQAPNGAPFDVQIWYGSMSEEIWGGIAQIGADALQELHIDAEKVVFPNEYPDPISVHGSYDMYVSAINFYSNDVDWLAYEYWSDYVDEFGENPSNFANTIYDSWRDQLLYGTTYEEVHEAASEMQKILHYNVPRLVVYENVYMQGYRNDQFTGQVEDLGRYITGPWTLRKIHKVDGTPGGTVTIAISDEPDSFNIYVTNSAYSAAILSELWPALYTSGPDLNPYPDLATGMLTETHSDNLAVPEGHTRFTVDIVQNATWSDGEPLTANDVAFSYTYALESAVYGNPAVTDLGDFVAAYAPNPYRVVLEFSTESYWHFSNFAYNTVIPEHIFNDETGVGYEGWEVWNPVLDPAEPHVTCGPFLFTDYEVGEFYEISYNPTYHYRVSKHAPQIPPAADISYIVGTTGNGITWSFEDDDPDTYEVTMNGTLRESGHVTTNSISHNIDGLPIGNYSFALTVFDETGYFNRSTTHVFVLPSSNGIPGSPSLVSLLLISVSLGSTVIILAAVGSIYRTKKNQTSTHHIGFIDLAGNRSTFYNRNLQNKTISNIHHFTNKLQKL